MKVIRFTASTGIGMFDPVVIYAVLEDGDEVRREYDGRRGLTPKQYLQRDGYEVNCDLNDWEWSED
jgi:hypothetical protein